MANINLPYVQRFKDRHGRVRHYYRRHGYPRVALPAPGSQGFLAAYEEAGHKHGEGAGSELTRPGTIRALVVAYFQTSDYLNLAASTRKAHRNLLDRFREKHGEKSVARVQPSHLEAIFQGMATTPAQASNLRKRLRTLFDLAMRLGWRKDNPVVSTKAPKYKTKGFTPWSDVEIEIFKEHWPRGTRQRLALALCLYTGQRRSDVAPMGRQHMRAGRVRVIQQKTGEPLWIKAHPELVAEIEAAAPEMTFILTEYGKPFSPAGFTAWFVDQAEKAGIKGRSPHGLRKAAGRRLAEAGCSAKEIMSVLGHRSMAEAEKYVRDADQIKLADSAIDKLGGA